MKWLPIKRHTVGCICSTSRKVIQHVCMCFVVTKIAELRAPENGEEARAVSEGAQKAERYRGMHYQRGPSLNLTSQSTVHATRKISSAFEQKEMHIAGLRKAERGRSEDEGMQPPQYVAGRKKTYQSSLQLPHATLGSHRERGMNMRTK